MADETKDQGVQKRAALDAIIRQTIHEMGPLDPAERPGRVRARLKDQALSGRDLDACVQEILREIDRAQTGKRGS